MNDTTIVLRRRPGPRSWLALGASAAAVLVMLLLIAVACQAANRTDDDLSAPPSSSTSDPSAAASGGTGDDGQDGGDDGPAGSGRDGGGQNAGGQNGGGQNGGGQDGGGQQPPAPPGPVIEYSRVAQQPSCPGGTDVNPIEGRPVVLEWKVTGTDEVTLSVDGPGAYATYPAQGSDTLSFPCEGREGDIQRHTYLLTATNSDGTTTRELVVEAVVHERKQV